MGEAREAADRMTAAVTTARDLKALAACYSEDAVAVTPDQGELRGRDAITDYFRQFLDSFTDTKFESTAKYESGNTAIDEGYFIGTNTGPLQGPGGESTPPTGKQIRVRECDVVVAADRLIREHRFYFDQMEFLGQLGLLPETSPSSAATE
jgi:ketosteroid isomerase-like protein